MCTSGLCCWQPLVSCRRRWLDCRLISFSALDHWHFSDLATYLLFPACFTASLPAGGHTARRCWQAPLSWLRIRLGLLSATLTPGLRSRPGSRTGRELHVGKVL